MCDTNFWDGDEVIALAEKALWGILHANPIKAEKETPYLHGYRNGWKDMQKLSIGMIEQMIEVLKSEDE
ncbi:MAG: hypothetical protein ACTSWX_09315 [Promethearchaeota archaeon]